MIRKLLIIATLLVAGCVTTKTEHIGASRAALERYGVGPGDTVLLRYANETDPNSSSRSEAIRVTAVGDKAISGVNALGEEVVVDSDRLFLVEERQANIAAVPGAEAGGNVLKGATNSALLVLCLAAAMGGGVSSDCPQVGD